MSHSFEVHVDLDGTTVPMGDVEVDSRDHRIVRSEFRYRSSYLARGEKLPLDPHLALTATRHVTGALPRGLSDAGPDWWGRRLALRANLGRPLDDAELLLSVDDFARIGALRLRTEPDGPFLSNEHEVPKLVRLQEIAEATRAVEDDPDDLAAVKLLLGTGSSALGGARPKASVIDNDRLAIAKFASKTDTTEVVAWEKLCLDLAAAAGIEVPVSRLVDVGRGRALILDRFDRDAGGRRVPYQSAFTITDASDPVSGDYLEIGEALTELDLADLPGTLRQLLRRVAFSIAMRNTDDHLKNHALLWSRAGWRLSPAFDITPDEIGGTTRATSICGYDTPGTETRGLTELAGEFAIDKAEYDQIVGQVVAAASTWREAAAALALPPGEITRLGRNLADAQQRVAATLG